MGFRPSSMTAYSSVCVFFDWFAERFGMRTVMDAARMERRHPGLDVVLRRRNRRRDKRGTRRNPCCGGRTVRAVRPDPVRAASAGNCTPRRPRVTKVVCALGGRCARWLITGRMSRMLIFHAVRSPFQPTTSIGLNGYQTLENSSPTLIRTSHSRLSFRSGCGSGRVIAPGSYSACWPRRPFSGWSNSPFDWMIRKKLSGWTERRDKSPRAG